MSLDSDTAEIIRGISGLGGLHDGGITAIASASSLRSVPEGTCFYDADEMSWDVYFVVSGIVGIRYNRPGSPDPARGDDAELLIIRSGSMFGVLSFLDGARRDMNATARERSLVLHMDGPLLKAACEADPAVGRAVYALLGKAAARSARDISMELRNMLTERG